MHHSILIWTPVEDLAEARQSVENWLEEVEDDYHTTYYAVNAKAEVWTEGGDPPEEVVTFEALKASARARAGAALAWSGVGECVMVGGGFGPDDDTRALLSGDWQEVRAHILRAMQEQVQAAGEPEGAPGRFLGAYRLKKLATALQEYDACGDNYPFVSAGSVGTGVLYSPLVCFALDEDEELDLAGPNRGTLLLIDCHT